LFSDTRNTSGEELMRQYLGCDAPGSQG